MNATPPRRSARTVYAVGELVEIVRTLLEDSLPSVWVEGEISNFSRPASGHWYFTLKDAQAQLRCAMFKGANFHVRPQPRDGDAVLVRAKFSLYPARGDLQLIVEHLEPAGTGALLRAFEALKARLDAEGLFDAKLKRPLPSAPRRIGLITSGTGAALHDMLNVLNRRWPLAEVYLYPVPVQGAEAPPAIVQALQQLPQRVPVDVILLARGGGSLEDLWAFNEEAVARAIRACSVPVVTGVGHEVDTTIADYAADLRAATPTAAAERITPDIAERTQRLRTLAGALENAERRQLQQATERLQTLERRTQMLHPGRRLQDRAQRLDELDERLRHALRQRLNLAGSALNQSRLRLTAAGPGLQLATYWQRLNALEPRLPRLIGQLLRQQHQRLDSATALLQGINPNAVLERGYALVEGPERRLVRDAAQLGVGTPLKLRFARGAAEATVTDITSSQSAPR